MKKGFCILILISFIIPFVSSLSTSEHLDFCSTEPECLEYLEKQGMPESFLNENKIEIICNNGYCESVRINETEGVEFVAGKLTDCTEGHKWCGYDNSKSVIKECVNGNEETIKQCPNTCNYNDKAEPICINESSNTSTEDSNYTIGVIAVSASILIGFIIFGLLIRKKK